MQLEKELQLPAGFKLRDKAVLNIVYTGNWINERTTRMLKPFGISEQQFNVLRILAARIGKSVNLLTIQEGMVHRMSNATRLVEKLRQKGLVERELCPTNRRMVEIKITKEGLNLLKRINKIIIKERTYYEEKLNKNDAKLLSNILDRLRE